LKLKTWPLLGKNLFYTKGRGPKDLTAAQTSFGDRNVAIEIVCLWITPSFLQRRQIPKESAEPLACLQSLYRKHSLNSTEVHAVDIVCCPPPWQRDLDTVQGLARHMIGCIALCAPESYRESLLHWKWEIQRDQVLRGLQMFAVLNEIVRSLQDGGHYEAIVELAKAMVLIDYDYRDSPRKESTSRTAAGSRLLRRLPRPKPLAALVRLSATHVPASSSWKSPDPGESLQPCWGGTGASRTLSELTRFTLRRLILLARGQGRVPPHVPRNLLSVLVEVCDVFSRLSVFADYDGCADIMDLIDSLLTCWYERMWEAADQEEFLLRAQALEISGTIIQKLSFLHPELSKDPIYAKAVSKHLVLEKQVTVRLREFGDLSSSDGCRGQLRHRGTAVDGDARNRVSFLPSLRHARRHAGKSCSSIRAAAGGLLSSVDAVMEQIHHQDSITLATLATRDNAPVRQRPMVAASTKQTCTWPSDSRFISPERSSQKGMGACESDGGQPKAAPGTMLPCSSPERRDQGLKKRSPLQGMMHPVAMPPQASDPAVLRKSVELPTSWQPYVARDNSGTVPNAGAHWAVYGTGATQPSSAPGGQGQQRQACGAEQPEQRRAGRAASAEASPPKPSCCREQPGASFAGSAPPLRGAVAGGHADAAPEKYTPTPHLQRYMCESSSERCQTVAASRGEAPNGRRARGQTAQQRGEPQGSTAAGGGLWDLNNLTGWEISDPDPLSPTLAVAGSGSLKECAEGSAGEGHRRTGLPSLPGLRLVW